MKHIEVVAAIIIKEGKILCVQRGEGKFDYISKKYEFPGGKVEEGELKEEAIVREIAEELHACIRVDRSFMTVEHQYPDFKITMHAYLCSLLNGDQITLNEHIDEQWLLTNELEQLDWAAADIPIVERLISEL